MRRQPRQGPFKVAPSKRLSARSCAILLAAIEAATIESPAIEQETKTKQEVDVPWQVVVHNDPINLMTYVTMVFQKVFGFTREKAEKHMMEVHQQGRSIVWSGLRERAELYVQQLHGHLLLATLERVN